MRHVWFVRHAESTANAGGKPVFDPGLSTCGITQAKSLGGHFDLVVMSPMHRCRETLEFSEITYERRIESANLREWKNHYPPTRVHEDEKVETKQEFESRIEEWKKQLASLDAKTILIIGHSYFWSAWRKIENPYYEIPNAVMVQVVAC